MSPIAGHYCSPKKTSQALVANSQILLTAINTAQGHLTCAPVGTAHDLPVLSLSEALSIS